jgi:TetR/AcrR family transcriptional regulator, mexJK operon transcriptional repressor
MKRARITRSPPEWLSRLEDPRDEEILGAAFYVFAEKGFHGATMLDVANRAAASKKTVYERFTDKAGLFRALIAWGCRQNLPEAPPPDDGRPLDALFNHAQVVLRAMMRPEGLAMFRIVAAEAARFPEIGKHFDAATRAPSVAIVEELATRLDRSGEVRIRDAEQFGADFIALLRGDLYFRVLAGAIPVPTNSQLNAHARKAVQTLVAAYASSQ